MKMSYNTKKKSRRAVLCDVQFENLDACFFKPYSFREKFSALQQLVTTFKQLSCSITRMPKKIAGASL